MYRSAVTHKLSHELELGQFAKGSLSIIVQCGFFQVCRPRPDLKIAGNKIQCRSRKRSASQLTSVTREPIYRLIACNELTRAMCALELGQCINILIYRNTDNHNNYVTGYGKPTIRRILSKQRLIHRQRAHLLLIRMVILFFQSDFSVQSCELLNVNNMQVDFDCTRYL